MNKGNFEADLRAELVAWQEQVVLPCEEPYYGDEDHEPEEWTRWHNRFDSREEDLYSYWEDYDYSWDFSDDEWAYRRDTDDFGWDYGPDEAARHYESLWVSVGYIPKPPIPFPYPVRAWIDGKLVDCYKPPC